MLARVRLDRLDGRGSNGANFSHLQHGRWGDAFRVAIEVDVLLVASRVLAMLQAKNKDQGGCLMNVFILSFRRFDIMPDSVQAMTGSCDLAFLQPCS